MSSFISETHGNITCRDTNNLPSENSGPDQCDTILWRMTIHTHAVIMMPGEITPWMTQDNHEWDFMYDALPGNTP